jgi:hypothetical protein
MAKSKSGNKKNKSSGSAKRGNGKTAGQMPFGKLKKIKVNTISVYATSTSDLFLKRDLEPIEGALSKVMQLQGYRYFWKDWNPSKSAHIGLLAQDLEKILPEAVSVHRDPKAAVGETIDTLGVDYLQVIPLLVEAIKEQQKQIEQLRSQSTL